MDFYIKRGSAALLLVVCVLCGPGCAGQIRAVTSEQERLQTRISEAYTKWTIRSGDFEGRVGYGMSEYLDQIIDDQPVGLAE